MAAKNFTNDTEEHGILQSFMVIMQKYFEPEDTEEWWDEYMRTADKFCRYYKNPLCIYLAIALTDYLSDKQSGNLKTIEFSNRKDGAENEKSAKA